MHLIGVHPMGVHLMGAHLMGVHPSESEVEALCLKNSADRLKKVFNYSGRDTRFGSDNMIFVGEPHSHELTLRFMGARGSP